MRAQRIRDRGILAERIAQDQMGSFTSKGEGVSASLPTRSTGHQDYLVAETLHAHACSAEERSTTRSPPITSTHQYRPPPSVSTHQFPQKSSFSRVNAC